MYTTYPVIKNLIWSIPLFGIILMGCSSTSKLSQTVPNEKTVNVDYSIIYYIHADSDYVYYDTNGQRKQDNEEVLQTAIEVAENAKSGEIFVFYQRPENRILGLFSRKKSRLYHYLNGEKIAETNYRHTDKNEAFLTEEGRLFNLHRSQTRRLNRHFTESQSYFLYFGHEIPLSNGESYHSTLPNISVNIKSFTEGLRNFLQPEDQRFNMILLSTCNNGSPIMAEHLLLLTDVMLASPQNLHLSHINSEKMGLLETSPGISSTQLAHNMADHTFKRLNLEIQSTITLSVFDFDVVQLNQKELFTFSKSHQPKSSIMDFSDNIDCSHIASFDVDTFGRGVKTWYKSAKFGRRSSTNIHSGWGCKSIPQNENDI